MNITVAHHVFASVRGYRTQFRSPSVTDSENAELESFSFGQTNDAEYIASLESHPAFIVRKLSSGRWAITRVFQGENDEYGRVTLLFHTLLISRHDWIERLGCDVLPILNHHIAWQDKEATEISIVPDDSPMPQKVAGQVHALIQQLKTSPSPVVVEETDCSIQAVRWVHRMLPEGKKEQFSYGYRVLSDTLKVALLCLARQALRLGLVAKTLKDEPVLNGRHDKPTVESTVPIFQYEPARVNKLTLVLVVGICIIGISGIIIAIPIFKHFSDLKKVTKIKNELNTLIGDGHFIKNQNERKQKVEEIQKKLRVLESLREYKKNSELYSSMKEIYDWVDFAEHYGWEYDNLINAIEKIRDTVPTDITDYPDKKTTEIIVQNHSILVQNKLNALHDDATIEEIKNAIIKADKWRDRLQANVMTPIQTKISKWNSTLKSYDPNTFTMYDPNEGVYANCNGPVWLDPTSFLALAKDRIVEIKNIKDEIQKLSNEQTFKNMIDTSVPSHKETIAGYVTDLNGVEKKVNNYYDIYRILKDKAEKYKEIESSLTNGDEYSAFQNALSRYDKQIDADLTGLEKVWKSCTKQKIMDFYNNKLIGQVTRDMNQSGQNTLPPPDIIRKLNILRDSIRRSTLSNEAVFQYFFKKLEELEASASRAKGDQVK